MQTELIRDKLSEELENIFITGIDIKKENRR